MLVSFCRQCLPEKVVIAFGNRRSEVDVPHDVHQDPPIRNGLFAIGHQDWKETVVEGDDAKTKENIVQRFGDRMVD